MFCLRRTRSREPVPKTVSPSKLAGIRKVEGSITVSRARRRAVLRREAILAALLHPEATVFSFDCPVSRDIEFRVHRFLSGSAANRGRREERKYLNKAAHARFREALLKPREESCSPFPRRGNRNSWKRFANLFAEVSRV